MGWNERSEGQRADMEAVDIAFAEEARIVCSKALVKIANGNARAVEEILTEFGQKCVKIVQSAKMEQEHAEVREGAFDLGALKASVNLHDNAPEGEAD